jgi:hypothetical protein
MKLDLSQLSLPRGALSWFLFALPLFLLLLLVGHAVTSFERLDWLEAQRTTLRTRQERIDAAHARAPKQEAPLERDEGERVYARLLALSFLKAEVARLEQEGDEGSAERLTYLKEQNRLRLVAAGARRDGRGGSEGAARPCGGVALLLDHALRPLQEGASFGRGGLLCRSTPPAAPAAEGG